MSKDINLNSRVLIEEDNVSIVRDDNLCINCGLCKKVCENKICVHGYYSLDDTFGKAICINCGQCSNMCPTNSIKERYEYNEIKSIINSKEKVVIISTSPSVRVSLGEAFGMEPGEFVEGKMISLLKKLGFNYVLNTNFAADLTIMEEANELVNRIKNNGRLPQFTSCCPAWVKYVETFYPEFINNLSTTKSPISMQGATIKTYFAKNKNIDPKNIINVALTPCTAKKFEIRREEINSSGKYWNIDNIKDMDFVITTRELAKWAKEENIDFKNLMDETYDTMMSNASGGGILFGNSGGVMESALRTVYNILTNENPNEVLLNYTPVRGIDDVKVGNITIGDITIKYAAVTSIANAKKFLEYIKENNEEYHFIEVMTCPGGCIGGGGQPKEYLIKDKGLHQKRMEGLYNKDKEAKIKSSFQNPEIVQLYKNFYGKPLSELAEQMLHTKYIDRSKELKK